MFHAARDYYYNNVDVTAAAPWESGMPIGLGEGRNSIFTLAEKLHGNQTAE